MSAFAGHYGPYVIPAWLISAGVLAWMTIDTLWRAHRWRKAAEARSDEDMPEDDLTGPGDRDGTGI